MKKFWFSLVIFSLVGQIAWVVENMYFNVFIYKMFNASADSISIMVAASAIAATLTTIFIGALSDKLGKRKIFISLGYIVWGFSILVFAFIRKDYFTEAFGSSIDVSMLCVTIVIIMDCVMTFFGSSANDACFNAWLTDKTDNTNRGAAEGINSMMPLVAILCVFGGFIGFDLNEPRSWTIIYIIIGAVVSIVGVLGLFIIEDNCKKNQDSYIGTIIYGFRPSVIKSNKKLYLSLIAFIIFGIVIQIFMPYLIIYYEMSLGLSDYVLIMAPAIILAALVTALYGRLFDKLGFYKTIIPSILMLIIGFIFLYLFPGIILVDGFLMKALVFVGSFLMMSGYLTGMAVFGAKIRTETPENMAGRFQGLRIVSQVLIPGIVGPFIGSMVLKNCEMITNSDGTQSFLPNGNIFLASLIVSVILLLLVVIYMRLKCQKKK